MILATKGVIIHVPSIKIGTRIYADHAPVTMVWNYKDSSSRQPFWRLNTYMLEAKGTEEAIGKKISDFFEIKIGSTYWINVWEAFKVYIHGELISLHSYQTKATGLMRREMLTRIKNLDRTHKQSGSRKDLSALDREIDHLKLLDAQTAVRDILFTRQRWFEHRDKP